MKITNIVKKNNYYLVTYNNKDYKFTEDIVIKYVLSINKEISLFDFENILEVNEYYLVLNKLIKKLLKTRLTKKEVIIYLNKQHIFDTLSYISTLTELKLINDYEYSKEYLYQAIHYKHIGVYKVEKFLKSKGVSKSDYDFIFKDYSFDEALKNVEKNINLELKQKIQIPFRKFIEKLKTKLYNKGFSESEINEGISYKYEDILDLIDEKELLTKDYEKHKSLDEFKLRKKLLTLGYNLEDINSLIKGELYE